MAQVIIRKLDERVVQAHKSRAAAKGISLEQELREVLSRAVRPTPAELIEDARRFRAGIDPAKIKTDSTDLIRRDRDSR